MVIPILLIRQPSLDMVVGIGHTAVQVAPIKMVMAVAGQEMAVALVVMVVVMLLVAALEAT